MTRGSAGFILCASFAVLLGCGARTETLEGDDMGGFGDEGGASAGSPAGGAAPRAGSGGTLPGGGAAGSFPSAGSGGSVAGAGGAFPFGGFGGGFPGGGVGGGFPFGGFGGFGATGGFIGEAGAGGSAGFGASGGIVGEACSLAGNECNQCVCQTCAADVVSCVTDARCGAVLLCVQASGCQGPSCFAACGAQFAGLSGTSLTKLFDVLGCTTSAPSACGCN